MPGTSVGQRGARSRARTARGANVGIATRDGTGRSGRPLVVVPVEFIVVACPRPTDVYRVAAGPGIPLVSTAETGRIRGRNIVSDCEIPLVRPGTFIAGLVHSPDLPVPLLEGQRRGDLVVGTGRRVRRPWSVYLVR